MLFARMEADVAGIVRMPVAFFRLLAAPRLWQRKNPSGISHPLSGADVVQPMLSAWIVEELE